MFSENLTFLQLIIHIIGIYALCVYLYDNLRSVFSIAAYDILDKVWPRKSLKEKYGNWAVVTGSTEGIGRNYANGLAKKGINIVLIAIFEHELIAAAKEIADEYNVETKWIQADFTQGLEMYKRIEKELADIPVGILVNNVGIALKDVEDVHKLTVENWNILQVNCAACTMMCQIVIKQMLKNGKGAIVNIGSSAQLSPLPGQAVYGASKSYVQSFTIALQDELSDTNIAVQLVTPMFVKTKLVNFSKSLSKGNWRTPTPEVFTRSLLETLGKTNYTTGYWAHAIEYAVITTLPLFLRVKFIKTLLKYDMW